MNTMIRGKRLAWLFAFLYLASYITRINLSAVIQEVVTDLGYKKSELSLVLVFLSVSYGLGQIINGRIGDKIKPQNLILVGLCTATAVNFLFPFCSFSIPLMCVLWTVNGFAQAMMWPPMVKIMVSTMDEVTYTASAVIVSVGSSLGTVLIYLISPLIISISGWRAVMLSACGVGLTASVIWAFLKDRTYNEAVMLPGIGRSKAAGSSNRIIPAAAVFPFVFIALAIVFQGMLRDGVTSWMPTYLAENFHMGNNVSILCTVFLAVFSLLTSMVAGVFYRRFFRSEVLCAAFIFGLGILSCAVLLLCFDSGAVIAIACMMIVTGAMHGVNLMLISFVPKRFQKYGNISTISGFINSFTYIGAAVATYGIAKLSELFGWNVTVVIWLGITVLGTACCLLAAPKWKQFIEG